MSDTLAYAKMLALFLNSGLGYTMISMSRMAVSERQATAVLMVLKVCVSTRIKKQSLSCLASM